MITREQIKRIPVLGRVARTLVARLRADRRLDPSYWLPRLLPQEGVAVQIGSNDGRTGDPLHDWLKRNKGWSAVLVEPVPFLFDRLKRTYSGERRFAFENAVINDGSEVTFYWVSEEARAGLPELPFWHDQLAGFSREHITNHLPELAPYIVSEAFHGITLADLFDRQGLAGIDLLHIDAEGADFEILRQLDLERFRPRVIIYERVHLSEEEVNRSIRFLRSSYELFNLETDILAVVKETSEEMQAVLEPLKLSRVADL
ncbi:MAG: FkbM family methyltransferase [Planctomycetota bacterium]|jgi:FkbM family methyltransferase